MFGNPIDKFENAGPAWRGAVFYVLVVASVIAFLIAVLDYVLK